MRIRMQLRTSRSGARSGSGNEGWFFNTVSREVTASRSVWKLGKA